jgi:hypothetical protein
MTIVDYHQAKTLKRLSLYNPQNIFVNTIVKIPSYLCRNNPVFKAIQQLLTYEVGDEGLHVMYIPRVNC